MQPSDERFIHPLSDLNDLQCGAVRHPALPGEFCTLFRRKHWNEALKE